MLSATRMLSVIPTHTGQPSDVPDEFGAPLDLTPDPARMVALRPQVIDALRTVFDPPWSMERMSEAAKLQLGLL